MSKVKAENVSQIIDVTCNMEQLPDILKLYTDAGQKVCIWGEPGIGKSAGVKQFADSIGYGFIDIRLPLRDPVDFIGLPYVNKAGETVNARPSFLPKTARTVVLWDELNRAVPMVMNAALQPLHDDRIGEHVFPENTIQIAACNNETDGGGVNRMPSALLNRFVHIWVEANLEVWVKWATLKGNFDPTAAAMLIGFLRFRPELFHKFDRNAKTFPTPRTWEKFGRVLEEVYKTNKTGGHPLALQVYNGVIGHASSEFLAFEKNFNALPDIAALIKNPDGTPVPKDACQLFAISAALGRYMEKDNIKPICQYLERIPPEYNVMAMKDAIMRDESLSGTSAFHTWVTKHQNVIL